MKIPKIFELPPPIDKVCWWFQPSFGCFFTGQPGSPKRSSNAPSPAARKAPPMEGFDLFRGEVKVWVPTFETPNP